MKEHEFWRDPADGRVYAVELDDGVVSGSCGPLTASEVDDRFLGTFDYSTERSGWLEERREEFDLYRRIPPHAMELPRDTRSTLEYRRVSDAMHQGVITCLPTAPLPDVARTMATAGIHSVVVWGDEEDDSIGAWGVVSDLDLVAAATTGENLAHSAVGAANTEVVTVRASETLLRAAELMKQHQVTHLVVLADDRERPVGVLSALDLARVLAGRRSSRGSRVAIVD